MILGDTGIVHLGIFRTSLLRMMYDAQVAVRSPSASAENSISMIWTFKLRARIETVAFGYECMWVVVGDIDGRHAGGGASIRAA